MLWVQLYAVSWLLAAGQMVPIGCSGGRLANKEFPPSPTTSRQVHPVSVLSWLSVCISRSVCFVVTRHDGMAFDTAVGHRVASIVVLASGVLVVCISAW